MTPENELGLWAASLPESVQTSALDRDLSVDLAIIGGGFTGCAAALKAAQLGASVVVLEANTVGCGGSGRNVGLVNAGLWLPPETILAEMGETDGRRLIDALVVGPDRVFDIIAQEDIACEATRSGTLHLAHAPSGLKDLQERLRQSNANGSNVQLLDAAETRKRTGSEAFFGALWNPRAGTVQPLAYCHGLARSAQREGALIFSDTPVREVEHGIDGWTLRTKSGTVQAKAMLQATNAYPQSGSRSDTPQFVAVHFSQFATEPLNAEQLERVLRGKEGCWDTALVMSSIRLDAAGRLIVGGMGNSRGPGARIHAGWARSKLKALYPELADVPFAYEWSGRIAMTADHIPKIQKLGPNGLSVFGYSGRGIAPGTVFGTAVAQALLSEDCSDLPVPVIETYSEGLTEAKAAFYEFGATAMHVVNRR